MGTRVAISHRTLAERVRGGVLRTSALLLLATAPYPTGGALSAGFPDLEALSAVPARAPAVAARHLQATGLPDLGPALAKVLGPSLALPGATRLPGLAARGSGSRSPLVRSAAIDTPIASGLQWRSGASCGDAGFQAWRGRPLDAHVGFVQHDSWDRMFTYLRSAYFRDVVRRAPLAVVSMPMMPRSARGQHTACAGGQFDANFRQFGSLLVAAGAGRAVVRLGWEANIGPGSHPWGIATAAEIPNYVACFQRLAAALKSTAPDISIEWTNAKKGKLPGSAMDSYPGDSYVDLFGVHYYDSDPRKSTQAVWDDYYVRTRNGGPWGLGQWLNTAVSRGRKLAVSEWGVWRNYENQPPDNSLYIANMYWFFKVNAQYLAYENYYNCPDVHKLYPTTQFPLASAMYQYAWSTNP